MWVREKRGWHNNKKKKLKKKKKKKENMEEVGKVGIGLSLFFSML